MNNPFSCPIIGCPHYPSGQGRKLTCLNKLIRHLKSDDHATSRHLLDHTLCNKLNLYRCTHFACSKSKDTFFTSNRALTEHNSKFHPATWTTIPTCTFLPTNPLKQYTDIIFDIAGNESLCNNWSTGINYILENYNNNPPHFRSTWRHLLRGNNKARSNLLLTQIIKALLASHTINESAPFWWLLFHFDMLILAPTPKHQRDNMTNTAIISQRLLDLQCGNIEALIVATNFNSNWTNKNP